jgi:hypothetical protein
MFFGASVLIDKLGGQDHVRKVLEALARRLESLLSVRTELNPSHILSWIHSSDFS